jgi:hypothetical protein
VRSSKRARTQRNALLASNDDDAVNMDGMDYGDRSREAVPVDVHPILFADDDILYARQLAKAGHGAASGMDGEPSDSITVLRDGMR